jgi:tetratricopeptide (TPR) repeat protein
MFTQAYADAVAVLGPANPESIRAGLGLGMYLAKAGNPDEAVAILERIAEAAATLEGGPLRFRPADALASVLFETRQVDAAIRVLDLLVAQSALALGSANKSVLKRRMLLVGAYSRAGRTSEAVALAESAVPECESVFGDQDRATGDAYVMLAELYAATSRSREARDAYRRALTVFERSLGAGHPVTQRVRKQAGRLSGLRMGR